MKTKVEQKVITVTHQDGAYHNFFFTPGSLDSMQDIINKGWRLKFLKDDGNRAVAVFEKWSRVPSEFRDFSEMED